jgi:Uma2 family endonuclease
MTEPARRRATYQDVLDAPRHKVAEIINGELHLFPRPRLTHASVETGLVVELLPPFQDGVGGPGGWTILLEPELHLGEDIVVPDIAGWRRERLPVVEDIPFTSLAPDWLCEILSPSTAKIDRVEKLPIYAAAGVKHAWLVHPLRRTLEIFRLRDGRWLPVATHGGDQRVRAEPFDAIMLDLGRLWRMLPAPQPGGTRASEPTAAYKIGDRSYDPYQDDAYY